MAAVRTTYTVTATPWEHGWELHVDDVGVTQVANLANAHAQVRDYIETELERDLTDTRIVIVYDLEGNLAKEAAAVKAAADKVASETVEVAARTREVVKRMKRSGISQSDIAVVMGVSKGRVSQLVKH